MSRTTRRDQKPPRLWLRGAQYDKAGKLTHEAVWIIKDGERRQSTGCGADDRQGAEAKLAEFIVGKHLDQTKEVGERNAAQIPVADVLALYLNDVAPKHAKPKETARCIEVLLKFFGKKMLGDINGKLCRAYVDQHNSRSSARLELEFLRAAINYHREEGNCREIVEVVLPKKSESRERWLTRSEAARLIWSCWRARGVWKGKPTEWHTRQHLARFVVTALYTTRRKSAITEASLVPTPGQPWIDLERGIFYGRAKKTNKRQPTIAVPMRLLAHMRRWAKNGQRYVVELDGQKVDVVNDTFKKAVRAAGLDDKVIPHALRHTGITWLAIAGVDPYEICRYAGITMEVFENVYAHHHPDFMQGVQAGFNRHRIRHRIGEKESEQTRTNVTNFADISRKVG